jgi:hypothetical protein
MIIIWIIILVTSIILIPVNKRANAPYLIPLNLVTAVIALIEIYFHWPK